MGRNWSLARRLFVGAAVWSLIMLIVTGSILTVLNQSQTVRLLQAELDATLTTLTRAADVSESGEVTLFRNFAPTDERFTRPLSGRYWLVARLNENGQVASYQNSNSVWDWSVPWSNLQLTEASENPGQIYYGDTLGPDRERLHYAAKSVLLGQDIPVLLIAAADRSPTDRITQQFLITLTLAMIVLAVGLIIAMLIQVRIGLKPLGRIEKHLSEIRAGSREKLSEDYPQEIAPLAVELNKLIEHNRKVVERARTHVGNLAHALKTPIAVLMNEARGDDPLAVLVRRQTENMSSNVNHYLKRAQAAARAQTLGARTPIAGPIDDLTRLLQRLFTEKGLSVAPGRVDELSFRGERQDLEEMLGNLLENACKWARTKVRVSAMKDDEDGLLLIHVDDDGPGLTEDERKQAVERGVRLDETAPGTGLGLSIVKDLAEMYSGRFELSESPWGGLRATLKLPAA